MVGLDGAWVSDFAKQGAITDLSELMADAKYDTSQLASQVQIKDKTYMIPVVNFVYPLFVNKDLLDQGRRRGRARARAPSSWTRPRRSARSAANVKGWALPLDTAVPNGIQNDVMSWLWASGGSMLARRQAQPDQRRRSRARSST